MLKSVLRFPFTQFIADQFRQAIFKLFLDHRLHRRLPPLRRHPNVYLGRPSRYITLYAVQLHPTFE